LYLGFLRLSGREYRFHPFEVVDGYKPKNLIDLIPMAQHPRVSESASTFIL